MDLYHAITLDDLDACLVGLKARSRWTSDEQVRDFQVRALRQTGADVVVLMVDLADLRTLASDVNVRLAPDHEGIHRPAVAALGITALSVQQRFNATGMTWQDSLEIVKGLSCPFVIPFDMLRLSTEDGHTVGLVEFVAARRQQLPA